MHEATNLPYFDILLSEMRRGKRDIRTAFGSHVHWGYWDRTDGPIRAGATALPTAIRSGTPSMEDFAAAAERLARRVCDAGGARHGERVLDVGCGFGGTIASLNDRFSGVELVGLNIDGRQLERARREVRARGDNHVEFVEGDACKMPLLDASFDLVLALECAFHFSSRERFFREALRVMKPHGRLVLCDIVPARRALPLLGMQRTLFRGYIERLVGPTDLSFTLERYIELGRDVGLLPSGFEDVTRNTLPTYPVLRHIIRETGIHTLTALWGTGGMEVLSRLGLLRYVIVSFTKRGAPAKVERHAKTGMVMDAEIREARSL